LARIIYPADGLYNLARMDKLTAPEFDPSRPLSSGLALVRAVLLSPRSFYEQFSADGPLKGPAIFVAVVSLFAAVLSMILAAILDASGGINTRPFLIRAAEAALFVVLSPAMLGVIAAVYLVPVRVFVGKAANFRHIYRMLASAYSVMVLGWIPVVQSFAAVYGLVVLMALGIRSAYRVAGLMALVASVISLIPISAAGMWLVVAAARLASG
jgi:hypothetical protein